MDILEQLNIHPCLRCRVRIHSHDSSQVLQETSNHQRTHCNNTVSGNNNFILYLPTVNLRLDQNPSFSFACHLANYYQLPLLVLVVVLDDTFLPNNFKWEKTFKPIVQTCRRLAFTLEAISTMGTGMYQHGAAVCIRVLGPKCRYPDHLTLAMRSRMVVTDEPFVYPFLSFVQSVERTCHSASIPCFRVDGSTTVPPCTILKRSMKNKDDRSASSIFYSGLPTKAWLWQKQTEIYRMKHIQAANMDGAFDPPSLHCKVTCSDFLMMNNTSTTTTLYDDFMYKMIASFPERWCNNESSAPGERPWMIDELNQLMKEQGLRPWVMKWPGADSSVPPAQTIGTGDAGMKRWNQWVLDRKGLQYYAKKRNDPCQPLAPSRMSCYLNLGIVSIFRLVHEVKVAQASKVAGADKFEEEIVKWREMSYAHAFSRGDYYTSNCLPSFAKNSLEHNHNMKAVDNLLTMNEIELGETMDEKWNSMQQYLIRTGELHNNVRMTWGKTISTAWHNRIRIPAVCPSRSDGLLALLCYLNDRFALDGLAPPSYGGILWCFGWGDNPSASGGISPKSAKSYKMNSYDFQKAESHLLSTGNGSSNQKSIIELLSPPKTQGKKRPREETNSSSSGKNKQKVDIEAFFHTMIG